MIKSKWIDHFREPTQVPNPNYPNGIDIDMTKSERPSCVGDLPYPAKRCGYWSVVCDKYGYSALITTAGCPDDPKSVRLPCKLN